MRAACVIRAIRHLSQVTLFPVNCSVEQNAKFRKNLSATSEMGRVTGKLGTNCAS
jgi:hypothetical protein